MISKIKYLPINWKNGMAFSQDHLNSENLAKTDAIRDAAALHLTSFNYGLLGGDGLKRFADAFRDNINNEKVQVSFCRAITQNGSRIEILNNDWEELNRSLSELIADQNLETSKYWYVILAIDPFTRIPDGLEDEQESPRRKPNTRPAFQLELLSQSDLQIDSLANAIPLAKFEITGSGLRKVHEYIPPCTRINSHEKLMLYYERFDNYMTSLKECSQKIIAKIKHKRRNSESNRMADDIESLCLKYLDFFIQSYDEYKLTFTDQPPIYLLRYFAKLARMLSHELDMAHDKNHMLSYFNQYATNISAAELNKIINNTFESNYAHYDTAIYLETVQLFLSTMDEIFKRLEQLDYRELAPRNVVKTDSFSNSPIVNKTITPQAPRATRSIRITRPGVEENLDDGLVD